MHPNVHAPSLKAGKNLRFLKKRFRLLGSLGFLGFLGFNVGLRTVAPGVTGQNIPPAGIYPGLKRPRLDYTRVYYGLGQFIPRGILRPRPIHTPSGQITPSLYQPRYQ